MTVQKPLSCFYIFFCFYICIDCIATSPAATYEAEVIKVGVAMLHGCCGVAQLSTAVVFIARHYCDNDTIWHIVAQGNHLKDGENLNLGL